MADDPPHSVVTISRRGADRLRAGHVWVYRSDIVETKDAVAGALVLVQELSDSTVRAPRSRVTHVHPRRVLGSALYSTASEIAVRMISPKPVSDLEKLVRGRI